MDITVFRVVTDWVATDAIRSAKRLAMSSIYDFVNIGDSRATVFYARAMVQDPTALLRSLGDEVGV